MAAHSLSIRAELAGADTTSLRCRFPGGASSQASYSEGCVTCVPPQEAVAQVDEEQQGVEVEVTDEQGTLLHKGVAHSGGAALDVGRPPAASSARRPGFREKYGALLPFAIISSSYLLFTITDGAVRMIVLLHAYQKGFTAMEVAIMFSTYELAGVVTNVVAGMMGARWGIKTTLLAGLSVQLAGLAMLFGWQNGWGKLQAILYVTASQLLCGVAKDLVKLGGKTVTKLVTPEGRNTQLFKLVSLLTGWKNSLKGVGYFLGAATVSVSYYLSLGILVGLVLAAMPWAVLALSNQLGRARKENVRFSQLFKNNHNINVLSLSRVFLFGSRDMWFEVPLPFFLRNPASGIGWSRTLTGAFLGAFIIVYGQMQSWTPQLVLQPLRQSPPDKYGALYWCASLVVPTTVLAGLLLGGDVFGPSAGKAGAVAAITVLLYAFCLLFAVNSAIHSYLIVRYSEGDKVAMQVGAYYASNALGRLIGTMASGALYTYAGDTVVQRFAACLLASTAFSVASTLVDAALTEDQQGSSWMSPFNRCLPPSWMAGTAGAPAPAPAALAAGGDDPGPAGPESVSAPAETSMARPVGQTASGTEAAQESK